MRLTKIKLAGFKSFVDPTQVSFPSNLTGVVGPNGCGKSNVIDAVRWVMGELSAKHLRGDNMADVIFNGSSARKPVGAASVELVFDNSDGKIGGAYASYNEISLKRQVARDGSSGYYINGARCRRKDITQPFGPTTPVRLLGKLTCVGSTKDLKPASLILVSRIYAVFPL